MKIAINRCFGGFGLSEAAYRELGLDWDGYGYDFSDEKYRTDPKLIEVVERLGDLANGTISKLKIVEIPDDVEWELGNYDGMEYIMEKEKDLVLIRYPRGGMVDATVSYRKNTKPTEVFRNLSTEFGIVSVGSSPTEGIK